MSDAPVPPILPVRPASTLRRDLIAAYAASGAKIVSWIIISAVLFRSSQLAFAMFALIRGTIGLLNYTALGMSPAIVRMIAQACAERAQQFDQEKHPVELVAQGESPLLNYRPRRGHTFEAALPAYTNGMLVAMALGLLAFGGVIAYRNHFEQLHRTEGMPTEGLRWTVLMMGGGIIVRLISDVPGAVIQAAGRISRDSWLIVAAEMVWVGVFIGVFAVPGGSPLEQAAAAFLTSSFFLLAARWYFCGLLIGRRSHLTPVSFGIIWQLISFGSLVTVAQLADFLYAPTDYILINRLLGPDVVAVYAPAVQVDAALLLMVSAIAIVLFPRAAMASAGGKASLLRQYYLRGTLASGAVVLVASLGAWLLSPWIFRFWLGSTLPDTRAILPLVLLHSVVGGSSAVGRSILLGMGKVKPFTASVLIAGVFNVLLSFVFVRYLHLGLKGIVLGTIIAVTARCAIWMPWYVLRSLPREGLEIAGPASPN